MVCAADVPVVNPSVDVTNNRLNGYAFDAAGNGSNTPDATYSYDGEGKRVKKISSLETTVFVYNASGQLVAEYSTRS